MGSTVLTRIQDGVATLTLNRPQAMNAFDGDTARAIIDAVEAFAADPAVRVMVVGGEGESFSAGGDFNWVLTWPGLDAITRRVGADAMMGAVQAVYDFPKPSIARVHGVSFGLPMPGLLPTRREWQEQRDHVARAVKRLRRKGLEAEGHVLGTRNATKKILEWDAAKRALWLLPARRQRKLVAVVAVAAGQQTASILLLPTRQQPALSYGLAMRRRAQ